MATWCESDGRCGRRRGSRCRGRWHVRRAWLRVELVWSLLRCLGFVVAGAALMALVVLPLLSPEWAAALEAASPTGGAP